MELKKEVTVFLACAALLGWSAYGLVSGSDSALRGTRRTTQAKDYRAVPVPDTSLATPNESRRGRFERDLFSPPRDTAPLPLLVLVPPPLEPLPALSPPTAYGPNARYMGPVLRTDVVTTAVAGLFEENPEGGADAMGTAAGTSEFLDMTETPDSELTVEERLARIEARKKLYDWIVVGNLRFGHIKNPDRFDLKPGAEVMFVAIDPSTGIELYPGQPPVTYEAGRLQEYGLADTPANRVELGRARYGATLRSGDFDGAIRFAAECLDMRNEAVRALDVAAELYQLCSDVQPSEVRPLLGLARCYELGFRFQDAFDVYTALTTGELHTEPEPWARLGDLYARFRMRGPAQEAFEEALRRSRTDWFVRWRYGRFLLDGGRAEEALVHLTEAQTREPSAPELRAARVGIRADLGRVLMALGRVTEAKSAFERSASADPSDDLGPAGALAASLFLDESEAAATTELGEGPDASFDLLFAMGLSALHEQSWLDAERYLSQAATADPFRAWLCWRTLSWMAEITGYPEEAVSFIERAYEGNPEDPWTLYQRGRLQAQQDDDAGAMESFRAALDQELDFPDALVAMGSLAHESGEYEAAERYYARALSIDPERPRVHARRALNFLNLSELAQAEGALRSALALDPDLASARNGQAWWQYLSGDSGQAQATYAELVDIRRNLPEGDLPSAYAESQSERIRDHESKEIWRDRFDRVGRVGNGWTYDQGYGAEVSLREGAVWIEGQLTQRSRTRLFRELPADRFLSLEAELTVQPEARDVTVGIFVSRESESRGNVRIHASVELVRYWDGAVRAALIKKGELDASAQDLFTTQWDVGTPMRVRIDKTGTSSSDTTVTLWVDDVPVLEGLALPTLGRSSQPLRFGIFVEGQAGRTAAVSVDAVTVIRRRL